MRSLQLLTIVCTLATGLTAQGRTWIVDEQGGPGAHFADIPPAVDAAADGDTILIRAGAYSSFATGKALTMLGEGSVTVNAGFPFPPSPPVIQINGLAAGKSFVAKNIDVVFPNFVDGIEIANNQGRVHLENVSARPITYPFQSGVACRVASCTLVTWNGGELDGRPGIFVGSSAAVLSSMRITGTHACSAAICAGWGAGRGMGLSNAQVWLSHTDVHGGSGALFALPGANPQSAITSTDTALIVTGDGATRIAAGGGAGGSGPPRPAISTTNGTVDIDTDITVTGSGGAPDIVGTATVVRRQIVSLAASGGPPGGTLDASVVSSAGDLVHLVASVPADPLPLPPGTVFFSPLIVLPLFIGAQGPAGSTALSVRIPSVAALHGATIALQAGNYYVATASLEFSNPVVVVLH